MQRDANACSTFSRREHSFHTRSAGHFHGAGSAARLGQEQRRAAKGKEPRGLPKALIQILNKIVLDFEHAARICSERILGVHDPLSACMAFYDDG